jgi:hypothetical protein
MEENNDSIGKLEEKRPLRILRRRWESTINMHFKEMGFEGVDWIQLVLDRDQC